MRNNVLYIVGIPVLLVIICIIGLAVMNGPTPQSTATPMPTAEAPLPTAYEITPSSYIGTWTGHDSSGDSTITITSDGKFQHRITSSGAVRLFSGTYTQKWNGISLQYDIATTGYDYRAEMNIGDNMAKFEASGFIPDMPVTMDLTRS